MANIWADKRQNENHGQMLAGNMRLFQSARKHSVKKQVLGELKNIIHNQGDATPLKGIVNSRPFMTSNAKSSLCVDVLQKQQLKQNFSEARKQLEKKLKPVALVETKAATTPKLKISTIEEDSFDLDLNVNTCGPKCNRSLEEIWGDMNMIDDVFLGKVINGGDPESDNEDMDAAHFKYEDNYKFDEPEFDEPVGFNGWGFIDMNDDDIGQKPPFQFDMPQHSDDDMLDDLEF